MNDPERARRYKLSDSVRPNRTTEWDTVGQFVPLLQLDNGDLRSLAGLEMHGRILFHRDIPRFHTAWNCREWIDNTISSHVAMVVASIVHCRTEVPDADKP